MAVTFQFEAKEEDKLDRVVTAKMTLREVKYLVAMSGPVSNTQVETLVRSSSGKDEADFIHNNPRVLAAIYDAGNSLLQAAGEDFR